MTSSAARIGHRQIAKQLLTTIKKWRGNMKNKKIGCENIAGLAIRFFFWQARWRSMGVCWCLIPGWHLCSPRTTTQSMSASYAEGNATKTYFDGAAGRRRITAMLTLHVCHVMSTRRRSSAALTKSSPICSHVTRIKTEKFVKVTEKRSNYGYPLGVNSPCITEDNKLLKQLTANVDAW